MKKLLYILAVVLLSAITYAVPVGPTVNLGPSNGTMTAAVYCVPSLNIVDPPNPPYFVDIGYIFPGTDYTVTGKFIKWVLRGPRVNNSNVPFNYTVTVTNPQNYFSNGVSIQTNWDVYSANVQNTGGGVPNFNGDQFNGFINLAQDQQQQPGCDGIATFQVNAIHITAVPTAPPGIRTFWVTLQAGVNL